MLKLIFVLSILFSLSQSVTIQCNFQFANWRIIGTQYSCYNAIVISDNSNELNITGNHLSGQRNEHVRAFYASNHPVQLNQLPKGIEEVFQNLLAFSWGFGHLTTISADDFKPFPNLQQLAFYTNRLTNLDGDLFKYIQGISWIQFSSNHIENVGTGLLDGLRNLTGVSFNGNSCINMSATTPAQINDLKLRLIDQCPPLDTATTTISTTTDPDQCVIGCDRIIWELESKAKVLRDQIQIQDAEILELEQILDRITLMEKV